MRLPVIFTAQNDVTEEALVTLALLPTPQLEDVIEEAFWPNLQDRDYMRIAALLALKSYREGGCPIGAVIADQETGHIMGKGHNTLVQEDHPYNHGETSAIRDAGRCDFSHATIYTSLSPCDVCATLIYMRQFPRVVVGDVTNACGNEEMLRDRNVKVDICEDSMAVELYAQYRKAHPDLDLEDWKGKAALREHNG